MRKYSNSFKLQFKINNVSPYQVKHKHINIEINYLQSPHKHSIKTNNSWKVM